MHDILARETNMFGIGKNPQKSSTRQVEGKVKRFSCRGGEVGTETYTIWVDGQVPHSFSRHRGNFPNFVELTQPGDYVILTLDHTGTLIGMSNSMLPTG